MLKKLGIRIKSSEKLYCSIQTYLFWLFIWENSTLYIIFVLLHFFPEMYLTEDGKGICQYFQSQLIKWGKLKLHCNLFLQERDRNFL